MHRREALDKPTYSNNYHNLPERDRLQSLEVIKLYCEVSDSKIVLKDGFKAFETIYRQLYEAQPF